MTKILELKLMTLQTGEIAAVNRAFPQCNFSLEFQNILSKNLVGYH